MSVSQQKLFNYEYKIAIKYLKMLFKTRGRFSVISHLRANERSHLVLKKTSLITYYYIKFNIQK